MNENEDIYEKYIKLMNKLLESYEFFPINKYNKYLVINALKKNKVSMEIVFIRLKNRIEQLQKEGKKVANVDGYIKYINFKNKNNPLTIEEMERDYNEIKKFIE